MASELNFIWEWAGKAILNHYDGDNSMVALFIRCRGASEFLEPTISTPDGQKDSCGRRLD